ncbi:putative quinol monooxygenase [Rhodopirellula sallentina]|uniref:Antibiotic biosynthesis monooxygenase n=1 Tax=Rhodopirellula sallentina SM41 TaxID=1263870 RepID=M5U3Y7_9BACT|nr:antibiotic biosynthesis monooxygenase [Rhodopirellula sallentina]EMI52581.1 Antibiotic biosynthesis monooxygenase [Rhodopirellula sallentina SM41]
MIQAVLRLVPPPDKRNETLRVLCGLACPTETSKGCRFCRVLSDENDDESIIYWAHWETRTDLENHFRSERFHRLLPYIEMSLEPPQVEICNLEVIGELDVIVSAIAPKQT